MPRRIELKHAATLARMVGEVPALVDAPHVREQLMPALKLLADGADELAEWQSLESAAGQVPAHETWLCNEHVRLFREFLAARIAWKTGKPWPNRDRGPSAFDIVKGWLS